MPAIASRELVHAFPTLSTCGGGRIVVSSITTPQPAGVGEQMQNEMAVALEEFLRRSGNLLPISIRYGVGYDLTKRYGGVDRRGCGLGTPHLDFTVDPAVWRRVVATLGHCGAQVRDGHVFLLDVGHVATLPGGYDVFEFFGIRTGIWHVQPERGFLTDLACGEQIVAKTVEGVRRKLVATLKRHVERLSKPVGSLVTFADRSGDQARPA